MTHYEKLAEYLTKKSKEICQDNECTEDNNNCESFAYMSVNACTGMNDNEELIDIMLLDVCAIDFFQGFAGDYIAFPLPWHGNAKQLKDDINREIASQLD